MGFLTDCVKHRGSIVCFLNVHFVNNSYNDHEVSRLMNSTCGPPLGLWERIKLGGNGIGGLRVLSVPSNEHHDFNGSVDQLFASIELRPQGLIIRVKKKTETYAYILGSNEVRSVSIHPHSKLRKRFIIDLEQHSFQFSCSRNDSRGIRSRLFKVTGIRGVEYFAA